GRVERHCELCPECRAELEAAERRLRDYRSVPPVEASEKLILDTLGAVEQHERLQRFRRRYAWTVLVSAAASVLVLIGFHAHYARLSAGEFDLRVLGQDVLLAGSQGSLRVQLIDRTTGQPVSGVPVVVELKPGTGGTAVELASFATNADGTGRPQFTVPDWNDD